MDLGLKGRKALICASSDGLGRACARALANEGCTLTMNGRNKRKLESAANEIANQYNVIINTVAADISTEIGRETLLEACPDPDILVNNNAGPSAKDFRQLSEDEIITGLNQNMLTPIAFIRSVIDKMVANGFGRIVNITSTSVYSPISGLDLSSGARAGLTAFVAGIARSVVASNVTINNLLPGPFLTVRLKSLAQKTAQNFDLSVEEILEKRRMENPARRFGQPEEFGHACAFLCSSHAGYITGQNLIIDGGAYNSAF